MPTLESRDDEGKQSAIDKTPAGVGDVDSCLLRLLGVVHHVEQDIRVVAEQRIAGELREETDEDGDQNATAHTSGAEEFHPGLLGNFHLGLDRFADLGDFGLDKEGVSVVLGMVLH